jgi:hypothetical protein
VEACHVSRILENFSFIQRIQDVAAADRICRRSTTAILASAALALVADMPEAPRLVIDRALQLIMERRQPMYEEMPARCEASTPSHRQGRAVQRAQPAHRPPADGAAVRRPFECWLGGKRVLDACERPTDGQRHPRDIDYRHLVAALKRKPGAFARWVLRDACSRARCIASTWERLAARQPEREACKTMVGLLGLAADGHEAQLADELEQLIELDQLPDLIALTELLRRRTGRASPCVTVAAAVWRGLRRLTRWRPHERGHECPAGPDLDRTEATVDQRLALDLCEQSDREGWPGIRLLEALFEHEMNEREVRRIERRRAESR